MSDNTPIWTYDLPDYSSRQHGNIILRESDGTVIYWNNQNIYLIRDDDTDATLLNHTVISGGAIMSVVSSGEFNATYSYVRSRTVDGSDLDQTSSSSSVSSSSSSSSSSS